MYQKILNFVKYNNAFTIIFVVCFFGFGITYAANPDVRESVYASEDTVVSIDNTLIVSTNLDNFNFNLRISSVIEDEKNYYAVYSYQTLAIEDGAWQSKLIEKTLTVSKEALEGRDLGLYVAEELGENINYELSYLKKVQKLEREKGGSQKVVTTEYSGLIGKLLDPKEKVMEGYSPVIPESVPEVAATVESNPEEVIVSTTHTETQKNISTSTEAAGSEVLGASTEAGGTTEQASTTPQTEPEQEPVLPAPEEMIDEELVQEVVEELLDNASSTPSADSVGSPQTDAGQEAPPQETPAPEAVETTPAPEAVSEPAQ